MSEDVGQEQIPINADTLRIILGINNAIQNRDAKLMLNDKPVMCVALDGTCTFDSKEVDEIMLTNDQLVDLAEQVLEQVPRREILKEGRGCLMGATNLLEQPKKKATLYDNKNVLAVFDLSEKFMIPYYPENEEEEEVPPLNIQFMTNLIAETDGEVNILWIE